MGICTQSVYNHLLQATLQEDCGVCCDVCWHNYMGFSVVGQISVNLQIKIIYLDMLKSTDSTNNSIAESRIFGCPQHRVCLEAEAKNMSWENSKYIQISMVEKSRSVWQKLRSVDEIYRNICYWSFSKLTGVSGSSPINFNENRVKLMQIPFENPIIYH